MTLRIRRRAILGGFAAAGAGMSVHRVRAALPEAPRVFLLVHGAWHGGWCWRPVADQLRAQGHIVFAPTLSGLGERRHLLTSETNLDTHVTDIEQVIRYEDLRNVVLVGHSYAGMVISAVADRLPDRIERLVYLDAVLPESGQSFANLIGNVDVGSMVENGRVAPMLSMQDLGITDPDLADFVEMRLDGQPAQTMLQPVIFNAEHLSTLPRIYIQTSGLFEAEARHAEVNGFVVRRLLSAGHDAMLTTPLEIGSLLSEAAK